ncbi:MAG: metalloregulator ArsR/SmtB family transcription factor [Myxococcota bacterium]
MTDALSSTFFALADPTRRGILARLVSGDASVKELAEPYQMSLAAVSKHLKVLEGAGLIRRSRDAQWRPCHLEAAPLQAVTEWLEAYRRFWDRSFERLNDYLKTIQPEVGPAPAKRPARPSATTAGKAPTRRAARPTAKAPRKKPGR